MSRAPLHKTDRPRAAGRRYDWKRLALLIVGLVALVVIGARLGSGALLTSVMHPVPVVATDVSGDHPASSLQARTGPEDIRDDIVVASAPNIATTTATDSAPAVATAEHPSPTPTATPAPTATTEAQPPTPTAGTATPAAGAQTQFTRFIEDTFDSSVSGWPTRTTETMNAVYVDGRYQLTLKGQTYSNVSSALQTDQYRLSADVAVTQGSAGLVFLAADPATFYCFVIRTDGTYAIQEQRPDANVVTNLVDWRESAALRRGAGVTNQLQVQRQGALLQIFVNGQFITDVPVPGGSVTSHYGFALSADDAQGEATFDNLVVEHQPMQP